MWEGIDQPLEDGNWPVSAASPLPYAHGVSQIPQELDRAGMDTVRDRFAEAARRAARCGFDLLELHCAHGYLLSGFLSPLTNLRTDAYGGSLENRLRFPLEVFDAVRAVWPEDRPMTVRISATDWAQGGTSDEDAVAAARAFAAHGADAIDVSTGQVVPEERPEYGRSYQTPYADRIRNALDVPVIAVGAISSWDDVNSLLLMRPGRPLRPGPPPSVRPALDPARGGRAGLHGAGRLLAAPVPRGQPHPADGPHRRSQAPAHARLTAPHFYRARLIPAPR